MGYSHFLNSLPRRQKTISLMNFWFLLGGKKRDLYLKPGKSCFEKKFSDKTKNKWEDKDDFVKVPGKYELVDVKVAVDEPDKAPKKKKQKIDVKVLESQLHKKVQELIELICDKGIMELFFLFTIVKRKK